MKQRTRTKGRHTGDRQQTPGRPSQPASPPKPATPDDVAVKPEHPGNIPAGTSANPVTWGEPYEVPEDGDDADAQGQRRDNLGHRGPKTRPG